MTEQPGAAPVSDEEQERPDENDPGEVGTGFATKGMGWSGHDESKEGDQPA